MPLQLARRLPLHTHSFRDNDIEVNNSYQHTPYSYRDPRIHQQDPEDRSIPSTVTSAGLGVKIQNQKNRNKNKYERYLPLSFSAALTLAQK